MKYLDESLLTHVPPFDGLSRRDIREALDLAVPRRFEADETIFAEGEEAAHFFLLLDGTVRVVRTTPQGEQIIALHIPSGQLFGFARAIGRTTYPANAEAARECLVLMWPTRLWDGFCERFPGFRASISHTVGSRLGEMQDRLIELATQRVEQRVALALLRLIEQTGRTTPEGIEVDFPITRQDLFEMTGTTLHTVSRLMSAWQRDGIVESGRRRIMVRAPDRLEAFCENSGT